MKLVESLAILLIIAAVFTREMRPQTGEWTSNVRFEDVQLQLTLDVGPGLEICFEGTLRRSAETITSFEIGHHHPIAPQSGIDRSQF